MADELRLERHGGGWALAGGAVDQFGLVNEYLGYLADRNYSAQTVRVYGFALLAFCRWLAWPGGHLQGIGDQLGSHVIGDGPADHPT